MPSRIFKFIQSCLLVAITCLCCSQMAYAELVVTLRAPTNTIDQRKKYPNAAIRLALEKTEKKFGGFQLKYIADMNTLRLFAATRDNVFENFVFVASYQDETAAKKDLIHIDIPIDFGISSYRICFINSGIKKELEKITSREQLTHYSIVQGVGWADTKILRFNGFRVIEANGYDGLFKMAATRRADLFCRGINEFQKEYLAHADIPGLDYDESFVLFYPLPRFLYLNVLNAPLKERIEEGLKIAYQDGSLKKLLLEYYGDSLNFSKLNTRKIFPLENPLIQNLSPEYQKYFLMPIDSRREALPHETPTH